MIHHGAVSWTLKSNFFFVFCTWVRTSKCSGNRSYWDACASVQATEQWAGPKLRKLDPVYFMEELSRWCYFPLYFVFCFSHCIMHEVLEYLPFCLFVWPDVVYLNFMYRNDLVTCVRYNKVTMKVTDTDNCYYMCKCFPWITTEVIYFCIFKCTQTHICKLLTKKTKQRRNHA